ncbi:MAG: hypothetical protein WBN16_02080 [Lutimonas sp.]
MNFAILSAMMIVRKSWPERASSKESACAFSVIGVISTQPTVVT